MPDIKHFDPQAALDTAVRLFWRQGAASTGIQDVVTATGLNRSSLYATFGGKQDLYLAALRRYVRTHSEPAFERLTQDGRGLPAVADFFAGLIEVRCSGEYARWGCMITNAHAARSENDDPEVLRLLDGHHQHLLGALHAALLSAQSRGQLPRDAELQSVAELLTLLAYGVNLRSRSGADPEALYRTVTATLASLGAIAAAS
ncbi:MULTISPECIES: TetR/AcrR family transcriptional regulator [unclassified Streptomyces]|uniref:TetR/AcrR family transcriptional regulator n=1 Tax=unclassified Streptomyces TaxID=2593676 RepID=UPI00036E2C52|nr:TetR/AcrR family transcriptional regulator [Streptomyces sp. Amel2xE9]MYX28721.1 TetR family transcriptional regulator [Streptomyces sp. SID8381]